MHAILAYQHLDNGDSANQSHVQAVDRWPQWMAIRIG